MSGRRGGLGRGLGALIPSSGSHHGDSVIRDFTDPVAVPGAAYREIPLESIAPNPRQPREHFDEEALSELVISIREVGLLQPVVVREAGDGRYELIMGERRLRAVKEAGLTAIPAIVRETPDDELLRAALLENLHRQQLNPLEEAAAYSQLLDDFGTTHEELASRIGRSRSHITNTIRLMNLPAPVQRRVAAGVISAGHARALLALPDAAAQDALAHRIVAEGLSVRAVEEIVAVAGASTTAVRRARRSAPQAPHVSALAERLSDVLETRVSVQLGRRRGKVVIEFASVDDLDRIVSVMAPHVGISRES
ncbi:MAG: ParB/RepB/Spo0J family partition protein [Mycobacteriales bacterium]